MTKHVMKFFKEEEGQGMTEYGLILGLVALAAVGALIFAGDKIAAIFEDIKTELNKVTTTTTTT